MLFLTEELSSDECRQILQKLYNITYDYHKEAYIAKREMEYNRRMSFFAFPTDIKISSVHSFKGFDGKNVILLIEPRTSNSKDKKDTKIIYTALTRARERLFIFDLDNTNTYSDFFLNYKDTGYNIYNQDS